VPNPQVVTLTLTINARVGYAEDGNSAMLLSLAKLQHPEEWAYEI